MKRDLIRYAMLISIIILFATIIYPTPYEYQKSDTQIIKINRLTGSAYVLRTGGWDLIDGK